MAAWAGRVLSVLDEYGEEKCGDTLANLQQEQAEAEAAYDAAKQRIADANANFAATMKGPPPPTNAQIRAARQETSAAWAARNQAGADRTAAQRRVNEAPRLRDQVATMNSNGVSPGDPMSGSVPGRNRSTTPTPSGADTGGAL